MSAPGYIPEGGVWTAEDEDAHTALSHEVGVCLTCRALSSVAACIRALEDTLSHYTEHLADEVRKRNITLDELCPCHGEMRNARALLAAFRGEKKHDGDCNSRIGMPCSC